MNHETISYDILYTTQKQKKNKTWQEGILKHKKNFEAGKVQLEIYAKTEAGKSAEKADLCWFKLNSEILQQAQSGVIFSGGDEFETSKCLVQVENKRNDDNAAEVAVNAVVEKSKTTKQKLSEFAYKPKAAASTSRKTKTTQEVSPELSLQDKDTSRTIYECLFTSKYNKNKQNKKWQDGSVEIISHENSFTIKLTDNGKPLDEKKFNGQFTCSSYELNYDLGQHMIEIVPPVEEPKVVTKKPRLSLSQSQKNTFKKITVKRVDSKSQEYDESSSFKPSLQTTVNETQDSTDESDGFESTLGLSRNYYENTADEENITQQPLMNLDAPKHDFKEPKRAPSISKNSVTVEANTQDFDHLIIPKNDKRTFRKLVLPREFQNFSQYLTAMYNCLIELVQIKINDALTGSTVAELGKGQAAALEDRIFITGFKNKQGSKSSKVKSNYYHSAGENYTEKNSFEVELIARNTEAAYKSLQEELKENKKHSVKFLCNGSNEFQIMELIKNALKEEKPGYHVMKAFLNVESLVKDSLNYSVVADANKLQEHQFEDVEDLYEKVVVPLIDNYKLNEEQEFVLQKFIYSVLPATGRMDFQKPIHLCQGVFGSGKSYLISVLIVVLYELYCLFEDEEDNEQRVNATCPFSDYEANATPSTHRSESIRKMRNKIIVTSNTNIAVDRILLTLYHKLGFTKFVRLGKEEKIHPELKQDGFYLKNVSSHVRKEQYQEKLGEAFVVGVTCLSAQNVHKNILSFSSPDGRPSNSFEYSFPIVIVDEATQLTEPVSLIPFLLFPSIRRALFIGDDKQLCPTVPPSANRCKIDQVEAQFVGLERSLFVRLKSIIVSEKNNINVKNAVVMLRRQYRVHALISNHLSNRLFYENQLINCATNSKIFSKLSPLVFVDYSKATNEGSVDTENTIGSVIGVKKTSRQSFNDYETFSKNSYINKHEADMVVDFVSQLVKKVQNTNVSIGIISLYKSQTELLRKKIRLKMNVSKTVKSQIAHKENDENSNDSDEEPQDDQITISTVDAFQGDEKDIIILSTVRSNRQNKIGFSDDEMRLNVAFSRAKSHLIIFCDKPTLTLGSSMLWRSVFKDVAINKKLAAGDELAVCYDGLSFSSLTKKL